MKRMLALLIALSLLCAVPASALGFLKADVYAKSIKLSKRTLALQLPKNKPQTAQLKAVVTPAASKLTDSRVTWTSADETVATVSEKGLVTGLSAGQAVITASVRGQSGPIEARCTVTVSEIRVKSLSIDQGVEIRLDAASEAERQTRVTASLAPANATHQQVSFSVDDETVASFDANGYLVAHKPGSATLTAASVDGPSTTAKITVRDTSDMTRILITAAGDVVLGGDPSRDTLQRATALLKREDGSMDYGYPMRRVKSLFERDDITIVNIEGSISDTGSMRDPLSTYNFRAPSAFTQILVEGSIEVGNVVNNHVSDVNNGYTYTKANLQKYGIVRSDRTLAVGKNTIDVKGVRVGFVGFQTPTGSGTIGAVVRRAKKLCDVLVVSFHFCEVPEYDQKIKGSQIGAAHAAVDAGANLVLGHHPHVLSGIELYKGAYIYYDLGALLMAGKQGRHYTFVAQQPIYVSKTTGAVESGLPTIYPAFTSDFDYTEKERGKVYKRNNGQPMLFEHGTDGYNRVALEIRKYSARLKNPAPFALG